MIDLFIALCVAAYFGAAWCAGRFLPKAFAACFPLVMVVATLVFAASVGLTGVRDWLMAGVAICVTASVTLAGRAGKQRARNTGASAGPVDG